MRAGTPGGPGTTGNNHPRILRTIMNDAVHALRLDRIPLDGIAPFDTSEHEVYTDEEHKVPRGLAAGSTMPPDDGTSQGGGIAGGMGPESKRSAERRRPTGRVSCLIFRAGDRDRTGDVQLGKLTFYR